jgi:hypothetical protein
MRHFFGWAAIILVCALISFGITVAAFATFLDWLKSRNRD